MRFLGLLAFALLIPSLAWPADPTFPWPQDLPIPAGLKAYTPTRLTQRIAVTDGAPSHHWYDLNKDDVFANAPTMFNPNRQSPWRVSGGMHGLTGWQSIKLTNVASKSVKVTRENIPIANAGRDLPGFRWYFPEGTLFADVLTNDKGKVFEVRTREKRDGKWRAVVAFEDDAKAPKGYIGAGKCATCHDHAGSSRQYGIMVRGNDTVFSFLPEMR